jgi:hypothetical protein
MSTTKYVTEYEKIKFKKRKKKKRKIEKLIKSQIGALNKFVISI